MDARTLAVRSLTPLLQHKGSLSSSLPEVLQDTKPSDRALVQELCYGTLRWYPRLEMYLKELLSKPLKKKDMDVQATLLIGIYQLLYMRIPDHAAISATVEVTRQIRKNWASKLVNGVLRKIQREHSILDKKLSENRIFSLAHPQWLIDTLQKSWPQDYEDILAANNTHPPLTLRLNTQTLTRSDYLAELEAKTLSAHLTSLSEQGITLAKAENVDRLPGFQQGDVSVQDEAAQLCAPLLLLASGQRVLDACCAPGGKTGHILESGISLNEVVALDIDKKRLDKVRENLTRLKCSATLLRGDAAHPDDWWDGQQFDRILLDAPCSATGVIRRNPDIKLLRTATDIEKLSQLQGLLLQSLWQLLKPGGILLYTTCSVLPAENTQVIENFIKTTTTVEHDPINADWGVEQPYGRQLFPQINANDGFYFARLRKKQIS